MKKLEYKIEVGSRGGKRDVYLLLGTLERRHIFTITCVTYKGVSRPILQHVRKRLLGALVDEIGLDYFKSIASHMYWAVCSEDAWSGKYLFEGNISEYPPELKGFDKLAAPPYNKHFGGYFLDRKLTKLS